MLSRAPKRGKETFASAVELAPVRLIGGFVCVDSHFGCVGCHFCLNRRYPAQRAVLDRRVHHEWAEVGLPPGRLAELVAHLPAIARGGVPVRFGHASDLAFQADGARELLAALPPDHPVVLLTRFPPVAEVVRLLAAHRNAMLHVSIAPTVAGALATDVAPHEVLAALAAAPPEQLFVMLGPLVEGSAAPVRQLLPAVPPGAAVGFKPLAAEGVPFPIGVAPIAADAVRTLTVGARALGLDAPPMAGCRLRTTLGLPFFRHRELLAETPDICHGCRNRELCAAVAEPTDEMLREEAGVLGLRVEAIHRIPRGLSLKVEAPVARADETYLSEKLGRPIFLSGIERRADFQVVEVHAEVLQRWERSGFYPVTELAAFATEMMALSGLQLAETSHRC